MRIAGLVRRQKVDKGSKSERVALILDAGDEGQYVLRRKEGNPFSDPVLDDLVGQRLAFEGVVHGNTLIVSDWKQA